MNNAKISKAAKPIFLPKRELVAALVGFGGFFIGRAVVFGMVNPLAVAFAATFMGTGGWAFYTTAIFIALGLATRLTDFFMVRYILAVGLLAGTHIVCLRFVYTRVRRPQNRLFIQAGAAGVSTLAAGITVAVIIGGSGFLLAIALLESVITAALVLITKRATLILTAHKKAPIFSGEDMIALALVLGAVIAGASDIYVGGMSLRFFMCLYVLAIAAYKGGAAMGASAGMLLGLMLHLAGFWNINMSAVLALAGMTGGFAKRYGRAASILALLAGAAGGMYLLAFYQFSHYLLYAAVGAGLAFMLTPQDFHFNIVSAIVPGMESAEEYIEKIKEETTQRLAGFASAFEKLASTFSGLSKPVKTSLGKKEVGELIDDLAARVCHGCTKRRECWEDSFYETYRHLYAMLAACGNKGAITTEEAEEAAPRFIENCLHPEDFLQQLNTVFALYKQNLQWHNRIAESRELVSQQLYGVSGIMRRLAGEIDVSLRFHEVLEEEMINTLLRHKIEVRSVLVLEDESGRYQVTINHPTCRGKRVCTGTILPILSAVLKRKMQADDYERTFGSCPYSLSGKTDCALRFIEARRFKIHCGVARRAKQRENGDSYTYMELKNGQSLLALSDGMGSGEKARRESVATVELLEDFLESGFDKELAVKMINSVLVLKSSEESFTTLDICAIDMYSGEAEFIKIGAWATFLVRGETVSVIRSSSLPIGMLKQVDLEITRRALRHDDLVVMVTDGVAENLTAADKEAWLANILKSCGLATPQDIADYVLKAAGENSGSSGGQDDMTVLAARIFG